MRTFLSKSWALPGRREGQGLALSPGSQCHDPFLHSGPPPPPLGAGENPGRSCLGAEGEAGQRGWSQEGEEWLFTREVWRLSRKPRGQREDRARRSAGWRAAPLRSLSPGGSRIHTPECGHLIRSGLPQTRNRRDPTPRPFYLIYLSINLFI